MGHGAAPRRVLQRAGMMRWSGEVARAASRTRCCDTVAPPGYSPSGCWVDRCSSRLSGGEEASPGGGLKPEASPT